MSDKFHIKPDGSWVFEGEDSRLKNHREDHQVTYKVWDAMKRAFEIKVMDKVYCRNCGADGGLSARTAPYVSYLCQKCWDKGTQAGFIPMLPDEEAAWRMGLKDPNKD